MNRYLPHIMKGAMLTTAVALGILSTSLASGQGSRGPSERDRNLRDRELNITLLEKGVKESPKREPRLLLQEINEDFTRLQAVNREMMRKSSTEIVLDFKYVSDASAEIKKRSARLRTNLVFPEAEALKRENTPQSEGLKSQLLKLDRLIKSFVTNPVFTDGGVVNAELAAKARGDLDEIIDLSDMVKKHATDLNKSNPKKQ
jgi:hypothetical protein